YGIRNQQADDKFDMISGTNGLFGAADGAFLLQKERRADSAATLDISGRDQQDQRLYLKLDEERLVWELERRETELRQEPPDPVLGDVAALVTAGRPEWSMTATGTVHSLGAVCVLPSHTNTCVGRPITRTQDNTSL